MYVTWVLIHLLALGAFWQGRSPKLLTLLGAGLNTPYGARYYLAGHEEVQGIQDRTVLMHFLALGAF